MAHAANQVKIADDRITLYQRDDVKNGLWHCRITMKGVRGYIRRSTGKTDYNDAKTVAIKILGELELREKQNQPLRPQTFKVVAAAYLRDALTRHKEGRNSEGRYNLIKGTLNRYLVPYFGKRDITLIQKKDIIAYRQWRQDYWLTGPGKDDTHAHKVRPTSATLKQEMTVLRGVFNFGVDMNLVSPMSLAMLKHEPYTVSKRPIFTVPEYRKLYLFMRSWVTKAKDPRHRAERELLRNYVLIMSNSGLRKGEARYLKWSDYSLHNTEHGTWPLLRLKQGKTGERTVVCQPFSKRFFERLRERGHHTELDHYIFCHEDGKPIIHMKTFNAMLAESGLQFDSMNRKRTIYSLRHTYATFRLENGTNVYWLKQNMGTSVQTIERHYGQTHVLKGIEYETAKRRKLPRNPVHSPTAPESGRIAISTVPD